jgi:phosphoribosylformylglycinamidine cyclo-ligase
LAKAIKIRGIAHITGGGFYENLPRVVPTNLGITVELAIIPLPPIFPWLEKIGKLERMEMYHIFNMGMGMAIVVAKEDAIKAIKLLRSYHESPFIAGEITATPGVCLK